MKSVLEQLAQGNINPDKGTINSPHYWQTTKTMEDGEIRLMAALDNECKELLKNLVTAYAEYNHICGIDNFIYGYRLGVLMTMEVFNYDDATI